MLLVSSVVASFAGMISMCIVQRFLAFGSLFYPHPSSTFIFPLINECDRCLVPLVWELKAGKLGFTSHGGVTLFRGWLCQKWKPLDTTGTHLH